MNALLLGSQRPTLLHEPPDAVDWRLSDIAVEWAATVAGYELDEWQSWLVRWTFARRADGLWAARDVGVEVGRQNGKNIWIEVVELAGLLLFGDRLIRHTAQLVDTSHEHFVSLKERIEGTPELMAYMPKRNNNGFVKSHGYESIEFDNGARLQFKARQTSSGRGPRPQKVVFDEALVLDDGRVGSMAPGVSAQKNPQLLFASSPPKADSSSLHAMRSRATDPRPGDRLFYAAWNNPPDTNPTDLEALHRANPSLGYGRLTVTGLEANRLLLINTPGEYLREHCGVPEMPHGEGEDGPIDLTQWAKLADGESIPVAGTERITLDAPQDRSSAVFSVAGKRADNLAHVSIRQRVERPDGKHVEHAPSGFTDVEISEGERLLRDMTITVAKKLQAEHKTPIILPPSSPAKAWRTELLAAGVELDELTTAEFAEACGLMSSLIDDGAIRHRGQADMTEAVAGLAVKPSGDVDVWSARKSSVNIAPFRAATCALVRVAKVAVLEYAGGFADLDDFLPDEEG